jgi:branched-chain amino acid transport system substrate-binding protein
MVRKGRLWKGGIILLAAVGLLLGTTQAVSAKKKCPKKIVFGQVIALSGPLAGGVAISGGKIYELWIEQVNKHGGIYVRECGRKLPVVLKRYDDKSDIGTMRRLLEKMIVEDKVDFILPPWGTAWLFAAAPIANKYHYILIGGPGGAKKLTTLNLPYFFQVLNHSETQAPTLAKIFREVGVKTVAVVWRADLHGIEYGRAFVPYFKKMGIKVVMNKSYPPGIKDLSALLKQAKALKADAFVAACYPPGGMLLTSQAIGLGINFKAFFMTVLPFSPPLFRGTFGVRGVEGVMGGGAWNAKSSPGAAILVKKFVKKFKVEPDYWGALYYYASLEHFKQAIEKAGTLNQKKIRNIMAKAKFPTSLGMFWYNKKRQFVNHPGEIGQWQKGVFEVIDPGPKRTAKPEYPKPPWPKKKK